ncbi:MAG: hypothetical protein WBM08_00925 [Prochlorococcaceae cyanobacterium]
MSNLSMGRIPRLAMLPPGGAGPFTGELAAPVRPDHPQLQSEVQSLQINRDASEAQRSLYPDQGVMGQQLPIISGSRPTENTDDWQQQLKAPPNAMPRNSADQAYRGVVNDRTMPLPNPAQVSATVAPGDFYEGAVQHLLGPEASAQRRYAHELNRRPG